MDRLYSLDYFRGVAIFLVLLSHVFYLYGMEYSYIFGVGRYGVVLFYIVSGFTIFYVLTERDSNCAPVADFYIRRLFRIAPLFYLLLVSSFVFFGSYSFSAVFFVGYLDFDTFNKILHVEWSIYVEALFYCIAPILFLQLRLNSLFLFLLFFLLSVLWRLVFYEAFFWGNENKEFYFFNPVNFLYTFFLGAYLFGLVNEKVPVVSFRMVVFLLASALILILFFKSIFGERFFLIGDYLFSIFFSLVIYLKFVFFGEMRSRIVESFGLISYSLYLWHYVVLEFLSRFGIFESRIFDVIFGFVILILLSVFSYKLVEKGGVKLGLRCLK